MTKQKWLKHMWDAGPEHNSKTCEKCADRRKTWKANRAAKERNQAMRDCGLVKVRGNLGGTYWE